MYYGFLLNMWTYTDMTEEKLLTYAPRYITVEEAEQIMATPKQV